MTEPEDNNVHGWQLLLVVLFWIAVGFVLYTYVPGGHLLDINGQY